MKLKSEEGREEHPQSEFSGNTRVFKVSDHCVRAASTCKLEILGMDADFEYTVLFSNHEIAQNLLERGNCCNIFDVLV